MVHLLLEEIHLGSAEQQRAWMRAMDEGNGNVSLFRRTQAELNTVMTAKPCRGRMRGIVNLHP